MKALFCLRCGDVRGLQENWVFCKCRQASARWTDPHAGKAEVRATDRGAVFMLGLNNQMISHAAYGPHEDKDWRDFHDQATTAPGYLFDKSHRGCWAVLFCIGETGDVKWAPEEQPRTMHTTDLEVAAGEYMKRSDEIGRHLKTCLKCKTEDPSIDCQEGIQAFRDRNAAFSKMSRLAFSLGLR